VILDAGILILESRFHNYASTLRVHRRRSFSIVKALLLAMRFPASTSLFLALEEECFFARLQIGSRVLIS
jgi:hypothetical protein